MIVRHGSNGPMLYWCGHEWVTDRKYGATYHEDELRGVENDLIQRGE